MNILGVDLGTKKAATCHITGDKATPKYDITFFEEKDSSTMVRFHNIMSKMLEQIEREKPELVICEKPFGIQGDAKIIMEMYGVIHYHCHKIGQPFIGLSQTRIKKYATGGKEHGGGLEKSDLRMQVYKEFGMDLSEDRCDAFWIAHMGMTYIYGSDKKYRQDSIDDMKAKETKVKKVKKTKKKKEE